MNLNDLKPLTTSQYTKCKDAAAERTRSQIGEKPQISDFTRQYTPLTTLLDWLALIIFLGALAISAIHILYWAAQGETYSAAGGLVIGNWWTIAIQQIGYLLMAESAMLLFFTLYKLEKNYIALVLAVIAAAFVVVVNVGGTGQIEYAGVLAPIFTIGVGFRVESLIAETIRRRKEVDTKYTTALNAWDDARADITKHQNYLPNLYTEIWDYLTIRLTSNAEYRDADTEFKIAAVERELERDSWTRDLTTRSVEIQPVNFTAPAKISQNGHAKLAFSES